MNNGLNKCKVDDSSHVKMLILKKMWKKNTKSMKYNYKNWVALISIHSNKGKMQLVNNGFNILKVNGSTHIHMLIIE